MSTHIATQFEFIENGWYPIALASEVQGEIVERTAVGRRIVLYRTSTGVTALDGLCPHRQYPFVLGKLQEDRIECGYHGLTFDSSGACVRIPGQTHIPPALRVHQYPTVERGSWVWSWFGESADADQKKIPEHWLAATGWVSQGSSYHVKARAQLILENLMDLSHETFIHSTSIGNRHVAAVPVKTEVDGDVVRGTRVIESAQAAPAHAAWGAVSPVERLQVMEFFPPSFIVVHGELSDANQRKFRWKTLHGITPITAQSSRYQFAFVRDFALDEDWSALNNIIVNEDLQALEAQEDALSNASRQLPELSVEADAAALQVRLVLRRLSNKRASSSK